ncbi:hypothetical protein [Hyphobacterium sp.]|uniref:hypothetical protein n=1 Tax=Hyphobacterium sp. TaxID=2004662 RepID=UPI003BAA32B9
MNGSNRRQLFELGQMLAQQARLLKSEGVAEAQKIAERAGDYLNLARAYPLHQPVPVRVKSRP